MRCLRAQMRWFVHHRTALTLSRAPRSAVRAADTESAISTPHLHHRFHAPCATQLKNYSNMSAARSGYSPGRGVHVSRTGSVDVTMGGAPPDLVDPPEQNGDDSDVVSQLRREKVGPTPRPLAAARISMCLRVLFPRLAHTALIQAHRLAVTWRMCVCSRVSCLYPLCRQTALESKLRMEKYLGQQMLRIIDDLKHSQHADTVDNLQKQVPVAARSVGINIPFVGTAGSCSLSHRLEVALFCWVW